MKKVLIVMGSVRHGRVADKVLSLVQEQLKDYPKLDTTVVDFTASPLPFFDSELIPAAEGFEPQDDNVAKWTKQVADADVVLILSPEYNHSYTPVLKNAIDWIFEPWKDKPVAFIGYGWAGGSRATKHLRDVFASNIGGKVIDTEANLHFMQQIAVDGTPTDDQATTSIKEVLDAIDALEV